MRNKRIFYSITVVFCICFVFTNSSITGLAQSADNEKPEMKNFGASLEKIGKKNKDKTDSKALNTVNAEDGEIIRIETTLIINDVLVSDEKGNTVKGLNKDDFIVKEDGELQEVEVFSLGDGETIPRSIVLIIDYSQSQLPYIKTSVEAAKVLVDKLNPKDRMAIVTDDVELLQNFTADKTLLKEKLESLKMNALSGKVGRSLQYSALMAALNEMFRAEDLRPIIIFQTDGDQLYQLKGEKVNHLTQINFSSGDILTATEKRRATVYTIIPGLRFIGMPEDERLKRARMNLESDVKASAELRKIAFQPANIKVTGKALKLRAATYHQQQSAIAEIAKFTGGWTDFLEQPEQADKIYSEILSGMNLRYVIGYYPTNPARDERIRKVKIEVRNHPEYVVSGRGSYILSAKEK
ncbi:MAG TPA: VWA domain-containing protein [Pyrinomonadaceae bacterium]|nr:VWA domain-containing protein [Pyrinomonadaceae bacterium]